MKHPVDLRIMKPSCCERIYRQQYPCFSHRFPSQFPSVLHPSIITSRHAPSASSVRRRRRGPDFRPTTSPARRKFIRIIILRSPAPYTPPPASWEAASAQQQPHLSPPPPALPSPQDHRKLRQGPRRYETRSSARWAAARRPPSRTPTPQSPPCKCSNRDCAIRCEEKR